MPYPGGYDASFDKSVRGLARVRRLASYRGFVFASLSPVGITLDEHLGKAVTLIDRSCDLSPEGDVELTAGWVKHRCAANWKTLPENDSDGYHLGFVHRALFKTVRSQYQSVVGDERTIKAVEQEELSSDERSQVVTTDASLSRTSLIDRRLVAGRVN